MSTQLLNENAPSSPDRAADDPRSGTLIGLAVTALAVYAAPHVVVSHDGWRPSVKYEGASAAQLRAEEATQTEALAQERAAHFNDMLSHPKVFPDGIRATAVNGEVELEMTDGRLSIYDGLYRDPLVLALRNPSASPDKDGHFLEGGYLGLRRISDDGKTVKIQVVKYTESSKFKPSSPSSVLLLELTYHVVAGTDGGYEHPELRGFDPTGTPVLHEDGSFINAGEIAWDK